MSPLSRILAALAANWQPILFGVVSLLALVGLLLVLRKRWQKKKAVAQVRDTRQGDPLPYVDVLPPAHIPTPHQIRRTVRAGFRALRDRVTKRSLRFRTPCFLLLGPESAGKSTLLRQLLPEAVAPTDVNDAAGCRWHFFDQAVAIEVDGRLLICDSNPARSEQGWVALNRALRFHRPERPIDGVVLAVPATDLAGAKRLGGDVLVTRAREVFRRLQTAQKILGVRVPMYIVITKCDFLPGFQELCGSLPLEKRDEIFGWSNPYALESGFAAGWIDEAFDSLSSDLFEVQAEILARGDAIDPEALFELSSAFGSMRAPVRAFLTELCRDSTYQESFFFRGLYLTGDGTRDAAERIMDAPYFASDLAEAGGSEIRSALPALPATIPVSREPYFLRDLFTAKIFAEAGLARPIGSSRLSRNRAILGMQAAAAAIIVLGGIGLWYAQVHLTEEAEALVDVIRPIQTDLEFREAQGFMPNGQADRGGLNLPYGVRPVLDAMTKVSGSRLASFFVPSSWISTVHGNITESLSVGYVKLILPSLRQAVLAKADSIVAPPDNGAVALRLDGAALPRYLRDVRDLGIHIERYDTVARIGGDTELENVMILAKYLFNEDLPDEFLTDYARDALSESYGVPIEARTRPLYAEHVVSRADEILREYYDALIYRLEDIYTRFQSAERVERMTAEDLADFRELRSELGEVQRVLDGSQPYWFDESVQIRDLLQIIDSIPDTPLTPKAVIASRFVDVFESVRAEKLQDLSYRLDPFERDGNALLSSGAGIPLSLSPRLAELQSALDTLFAQPFIAVGPPAQRRPPPAEGARVRWDVAGLDRALQEYQQFQGFLDARQASEPPGMANLVQGLATVQLESALGEAVARSRVPDAPSYAFGQRDRERDLRNRIAAFQEPSRRLVQILEISDRMGLSETYDEVAFLYVDQALEMLEETDELLEEGGAYRPVGGSLASWDGTTPATFAAFRTRDAEELDRYLAQQRTRIRYLIDNFAAPILGGLLSEPLAPFLGNGSSPGEALVLKWGDLINELDRYEAESGANSVQVLEDFIREEMGTADLGACLANVGRPAAGGGTDFFLVARNRLRNQLYSRCQQLASDQAEQGYERIRSYFNANLAGRYPFTRGAETAVTGEADVNALRELFRLMDAIGPVRTAVVQSAQAAFLRDMDEVREFLGPLAAETQPDAAGVDVSVNFRANRGEEAGADQIVDWTLTVGDAVLGYRGQGAAQTARWQVGEPATLALRWALQSEERPGESGSASTSDRQATFRFAGRWALLRLIQNHLTGAPGRDGYLLRFEIPTTRRIAGSGSVAGEARVFIQVALAYPDGAAPPPLPLFPVQAP